MVRLRRHNIRNELGVVLGLAADRARDLEGTAGRKAELVERNASRLLGTARKARKFDAVFENDALP